MHRTFSDLEGRSFSFGPEEANLIASCRILEAVKHRESKLDLAFLRVTDLPPEVGQLTNLTWLSAQYNRLSRLPPEIGKLTSLEGLDLDFNMLVALPPEIGKLTNLTHLTAQFNFLSSLPPEVGKLTNLKYLDLQGNCSSQLDVDLDDSAEAIREFLKEFRAHDGSDSEASDWRR